MKKMYMAGLVLALCCVFFAACGCTNSAAPTTVPTTVMPTVPVTTAPTTAATTEATTSPTTSEPATNPTDIQGNTGETAGENGMVESESPAVGEDGMTDQSRHSGPIYPIK